MAIDEAATRKMMREKLPDKWMIKRFLPKNGGSDIAYWIAANPSRMEGQVFAKSEWNLALAYVVQMTANGESDIAGKQPAGHSPMKTRGRTVTCSCGVECDIVVFQKHQEAYYGSGDMLGSAALIAEKFAAVQKESGGKA